MQSSVLVMSSYGRPTLSQWPRSTSSLCPTSSGVLANRLHASAYRATRRRVFRSPPPPIRISGRGS